MSGKQNKYRLSKKQTQIMQTLCAGNTDDSGAIISWLDMDQLLERLPYRTTKASMSFSIRYLIGKEMLVKGRRELRRTKVRNVIIPTNLGFSLINKTRPLGFYEDDDIVETY